MEDVANRALFYGFVLALVLIAVVYYIGLSTDAPALASSMRTLVYAFTGRNSSGKFADYPSGGSKLAVQTAA